LAYPHPASACPACGSRYLAQVGIGTQRVEDELALLLGPDVDVIRMDADSTRRKGEHQRLLEQFDASPCAVLVGTQMIAKGLDFPNVALVGVVAADLSLNLPDYRSVERTFQLITQVAGRAGRAEVPGRVIVQTYDPDHYGIQLAAAQDYRAFYTRESAYRRAAMYPPFTVIARIVYSGEDEEAVKAAALADEARLRAFLDEADARRDAIQMAAAEAPIRQIRGKYRWQLLLKLYFKADLDAIEARMQALADAAPEGVRAELEVNPNNLF
jgi:primosomal protein N' (replication factor Y)